MRGPIGSWRRWVGAAAVFALTVGWESTASGVVAGQQAPSRTPRLDPGAASAPYNPDAAAQDDERMKMVNEELRRRIPADTTRLVELTRELKEMVGKAATDEVPVGAVHKAAEIEKLARDLKKRMQSE